MTCSWIAAPQKKKTLFFPNNFIITFHNCILPTTNKNRLTQKREQGIKDGREYRRGNMRIWREERIEE
jgi:hypothetical protein